MYEMTDKERIDRLEQVVGTLITWIPHALSQTEQKQLLDMLQVIKLNRKRE